MWPHTLRRSRSRTRSTRGVVRRPSVGARVVDRTVDHDARARRGVPRRAAAVALAAPPGDGRVRPARGAGHLLGPAAGAAAAPPAGVRRPVPAVAVPALGTVVAGAPVLAVRRPDGPPVAHHGQAARRPKR